MSPPSSSTRRAGGTLDRQPGATPVPGSILAPAYRMATIGMVALVALGAFEALAVATAMPTVARELDGLRLYSLAFGSTMATSVIGMVLAGRWSDRNGPGLPLYAGLLSFVLGLILAGLAQDMGTLIAGRLFQGLGAGAYSVALYVIVGRLYPPALRPRMFAAFSTGWVVPSLVGPALSGLIVQYASWRWVFLGASVLAVPAGLLLFPTVRALHTSAAHHTTDRRISWACGAALAILLLYLGGQQSGPEALPWLLSAAVVLLVCMQHLLPSGTLRFQPGLPSVIALRGVAAAAFFSCEVFLPLLLSRERGLSPTLAGVILSAGALGWAASSWYQGNRLHTHSRQRLARTGVGLLAIGIAMTALALTRLPVVVAVAGWIIAGLGMGLVYASLSVLTLSLSPVHEQGRNSSALQLSEASAVATALAVAGSLFARFVEQAPNTAYAACMMVSGGSALLALWIARRLQE